VTFETTSSSVFELSPTIPGGATTTNLVAAAGNEGPYEMQFEAQGQWGVLPWGHPHSNVSVSLGAFGPPSGGGGS
jgi:hypothetical protein